MFHGEKVRVEFKIKSLGEPVYPGDLVRWAPTYQDEVILAQRGAQRASGVSVQVDGTPEVGDESDMSGFVVDWADPCWSDDFAMGV